MIINEKNRHLYIKIPYEYLIVIVSALSLSFISLLYIINNKLTAANEAIYHLQKKSDNLEVLLSQLFERNATLSEYLNTIVKENHRLERLLSEIQSKNTDLLINIAELKHTITGMTTHTSHFLFNIDFNLLLTILFGTAVVGVCAYGGYSLVTVISAKYANSSLGLLLSGIDKKLILLGEKVKIIQPPENEYTFIDRFSNTIKILLKGENVTDIRLDRHGTFIDIGDFFNDVFQEIGTKQNLIDTLQTKLVAATVAAASPVGSTIMDNASLISGAGIYNK